jgi:hypothetical protein
MILFAQLAVYLLALAGIIGGALGALFFAGGAFNQARPRDFRIRRGVYAALCVCAIVASATLGFVGIAAIMYFAQQT